MTIRARFHDKGAVFETLFSENTPETVISSLPDAEKTRYDIFGNGRYNVAMQRGVNSSIFITAFPILSVGVF